ncbi:MAG TPA: pectate lyase [Pyrinomonadaceae bacterium]|jgi:pectinesterase
MKLVGQVLLLDSAKRDTPFARASAFVFAVLIFALTLAQAQPAKQNPKPQIRNPKSFDLIVAADGAGDVKSVQEAINKVPENNKTRFVIFIKPGVYKEQIRIPASKPYISFVGEKAETTRLTFNLANKDAGSTSASYSFYVGAHDFYAENVTFENSFGTGSQAVAVLTEADRAVFKNCRFLGWQDTLYAKNGRQYYENCYIEGHVDFIFGQAAAVFENCVIHSKGDGYIAAPMRFAADEASGFVFIDSKLTGENTKEGVYLARPWRDYGRTVFLDTEMGAHIRPEGWHHWLPEREKTAYFAEFNSKGAGAGKETRVKWAHQLSKDEAKIFRAENFLKGADGWNPKKADDEWQQKNAPDYKLVSWNRVLDQKPLWYAVDEATRIANQVILYQRENGGWEKNVDMAAMLTQSEREKLLKEKSSLETTIDNGATTTQLRYLAKVVTAKNIEAHKTAFLKGLDFLLSMQYENGGFPQFFPLKNDYSRRVTFNDNAMINALKLLRDVAKKKEDFLFVDEQRRAKAEKAIEKALSLILKTQVVIDGKKTIWAAQYDENTLKPAAARKFEPISLTAGESVGIVRFLMLDSKPNQATIDAVESAVQWYRANKIEGIRWETKGAEHKVVKDKNAPPIWARFYQIETMRPIFVGRDAIIKYDVAEIEAERRNGYAWYVEEPNELLNKDYPKWLKSQNRLR